MGNYLQNKQLFLTYIVIYHFCDDFLQRDNEQNGFLLKVHAIPEKEVVLFSCKNNC